jgi:hypothetical protein
MGIRGGRKNEVWRRDNLPDKTGGAAYVCDLIPPGALRAGSSESGLLASSPYSPGSRAGRLGAGGRAVVAAFPWGMGVYAAEVLRDPAFELNPFGIQSVFLAVVEGRLSEPGAHPQRLPGETSKDLVTLPCRERP